MNTALAQNNVVQFPVERTKKAKTRTITSERPHEPVQPIKDVADIKAAKEYLLTQAPTPDHMRNYMMFVVNINNAARISDLLKLRIGDVLNRDGSIKDEVFIKESKTGKTRYLFFGPASKEAIELYLEVLPRFKMSDYLFASRKRNKDGSTRPVGRKQAWHIISELGKAISMDREEQLHWGTHSLRKSFGYHKIKQHPNDPMIVAKVSEMYNHSNMNVTYRYLGIDVEEKKQLCIEGEL